MPEAGPAPAVRALTCPSCGGTVTLRAAGYTVSVACQYCGSILDVTNPQVKILTRYHEAAAELEIPLGTRGTIEGVEWEAIGYLRRSEGGQYGWEEYLLFNPYHGYRWLVNVRDGWSFGEMLTQTPDSGIGGLALAGQMFQSFFRDGQAQVDYVVGEFYWRVKAGETVETDDYVRPGWMLSREANRQEVSWTLLRLLDPKEMQAFGVKPGKPWPPLPHQPSPYGPWLKTGFKLFAAAAAALVLFFFVFGGSNQVASASFPIAADERDQTATLGPITLNRPWQTVTIRADVPALDNGWVDLDYALVDRATQKSYEASGAAERYSGSDSDGPWNEGSSRKTMTIVSVPRGTYDLVIDFDGKRWIDPASPVGSFGDFLTSSAWNAVDRQPQLTVTVWQGAISGWNLLVALILLPIPLIFAFVGYVRFEQARQGESDVGLSGAAAMFTGSDDDE